MGHTRSTSSLDTPSSSSSLSNTLGSGHDVPEEVAVDRYGFFTHAEDLDAPMSPHQKKSVEQETSRADKWVRMMSQWSGTYQPVLENKNADKKHYRKLKERVRKGIPDRCRGRAWGLIAGVESRRQMVKEVRYFEKMVERGMHPQTKSAQEYIDVIERDLSRTFPHHEWFMEKGKKGQAALRNVLVALAVQFPDVGYCQGMGFIAAMLLIYMSEEEAFWMMVVLLERYGLCDMFRPGFPLLKHCFSKLEMLMERALPRVAKHLQTIDVHPSLYSSQWFITVFTSSLSFGALLRIWDVFLLEGWKMVYRVVLAILKNSEVMLSHAPFEVVLMSIKGMTEDERMTDPQAVIRLAISMKVRNSDVKEHRFRDDSVPPS